MKIKLGEFNNLKALRSTEPGFYLGNEEEEEVLLPNKYVPEGFEVDMDIDVFIYKDSEDRIIATNLKPLILLNEYGALECVAVNDHGAFFAWGLEKDLMVPYAQQAQDIEVGEVHVVYLYHDKRSDRLAGTTKIKQTLKYENVELEVGQEVNLMAFEEIDQGISVIVDKKYSGIIYHNEVFQDVEPGQILQGFVKKLREDGKVDVSLNRFGYRAVEDHTMMLIQILKDNDGFLPVNDKSSPEQISEMFGISKKLFKKTIGLLYKLRKVEITEDGIRLVGD